MFEKHFPSPISVGDFFGEVWMLSAAVVTLVVSLFSLALTSLPRLSSEDWDVDSSDDSAIFSRSLLSQSYMWKNDEKKNVSRSRRNWENLKK